MTLQRFCDSCPFPASWHVSPMFNGAMGELAMNVNRAVLTFIKDVLKDLGLGLFALGLGSSVLVVNQTVALLQLSVVLSFLGLFMVAAAFVLVVAFKV